MPKSRTSHLKTPAQRRKALLLLQQEGTRKVGKTLEAATKKLERKELATKALYYGSAAASVALPAGAAVQSARIAATQAAAKAASANAAKHIVKAETGKQAAKTAEKKARGEVQKRLTSPSRRRAPRQRLQANRKEAAAKETPAKRSGPDPRGSSKTHDSHKAVRKQHPEKPTTQLEKVVREADAKKARVKNYGKTDKQKAEAKDRSDTVQKYFKGGTKGDARRQRVGDKRRLKVERKGRAEQQRNIDAKKLENQQRKVGRTSARGNVEKLRAKDKGWPKKKKK